MIDYLNRNKLIIGIILTTIVLLVGGIILFSAPGTKLPQKKVSEELLVPPNATITSGINKDGVYLPASATATLSLVEFGDYECPACGTYNPLVKQLLTEFSGKINFVFRNYPLPQHKNAMITSYAAEAAGLQGKYWQMHDKIFETQNDWANLTDPKNTLITYAKDLGLDVNLFTTDLDSSFVKNKVQGDYNDGNTVGLSQTPTFYLNGGGMALTGTYEQLKNVIQDNLAAKPTPTKK